MPQPGLDGLDSLLQEVGRAGLPVEWTSSASRRRSRGRSTSPPIASCKKGLTNVLKHAHARRADVTVRYEPHELEIEVRDDGDGAATNDGLGHGLVGIRERVKIYGGEMRAGSENGDGFVLKTRLPLAGETP